MHNLNLGDHDHSPVLLLDVDPVGEALFRNKCDHGPFMGRLRLLVTAHANFFDMPFSHSQRNG